MHNKLRQERMDILQAAAEGEIPKEAVGDMIDNVALQRSLLKGGYKNNAGKEVNVEEVQ